jgi:hypothetical protein
MRRIWRKPLYGECSGWLAFHLSALVFRRSELAAGDRLSFNALVNAPAAV